MDSLLGKSTEDEGVPAATRKELSMKVDDTELRLWVEDLLVHMGGAIQEFFESQKRIASVDPKFKVENLPAFHDDMRKWWVLSFGNFKKEHPQPKPNKITLNKFMKAPTASPARTSGLPSDTTTRKAKAIA